MPCGCCAALSWAAQWLKQRKLILSIVQFDDSLDTYPVHGVGGTVGAILTGVFATKAVNSAGNNGLLYGNPGLLVPQIISVVATYIFAAVGTFIILKLLSFVMDLRVKPSQEEQGLDINEHGEEGYGEEFTSGLGLAGASGELR